MGQYDWVVAVFLASSAAFLSNIGVLLQKKCHQKAANNQQQQQSTDMAHSTDSHHNEHSSSSSSSKPAYHTSSIWRLGLFLVVMGSWLDFYALSFGSQSLIAPLASLNLVSNVICAPVLLSEHITHIDLISTLLIITGSVIAVVFGSHNNKLLSVQQLFESFERVDFLIYASCIVIVIAVLTREIRRIERVERAAVVDWNVAGDDTVNGQKADYGPTANAIHTLNSQQRSYTISSTRDNLFQKLAYPTISGLYGSCTMLLAKGVATLLTQTLSPSTNNAQSTQISSLHGDDKVITTTSESSNSNMFLHPQSYIVLFCMLFCIFAQIKYLNSGLKRFDSVVVVPIFSAVWIVGSVVSGLIFYKEYLNLIGSNGVWFSMGVLITVCGVLILSRKQDERKNEAVVIVPTSEVYSEDFIEMTRALSQSHEHTHERLPTTTSSSRSNSITRNTFLTYHRPSSQSDEPLSADRVENGVMRMNGVDRTSVRRSSADGRSLHHHQSHSLNSTPTPSLLSILPTFNATQVSFSPHHSHHTNQPYNAQYSPVTTVDEPLELPSRFQSHDAKIYSLSSPDDKHKHVQTHKRTF